MTNNPTKLSLSEILAEAETIAKDAQTIFGHLSAAQINWKPGVGQWSVGQCFDHLITANREFFPQFDQVIKGEKKSTLWQSMPFLPGFFGKMLINGLNPKSQQKFKAPKNFQPSSSDIDSQIIGKFIANQDEVIKKIESAKRIDMEKVIIYSPVTKVMTYSMLDACRIIVTHERRHFKQAQRVMDERDFPKG